MRRGKVIKAYEETLAWVQAQDYAALRESSEYYYYRQGYPQERLLTKLMMPLEHQEKQ